MKLSGQEPLPETQARAALPDTTLQATTPTGDNAWQRFLAWYLGWFATIFKPRR